MSVNNRVTTQTWEGRVKERERERGVGAQTERFISTAAREAPVPHSFLKVREGLRKI